MGLSSYIYDTTELLNDFSYSFVTKKTLIRWINEARRNCAKRTGCARRMITGQSAFGATSQPGLFIPGAAQPGSLPGAFPAPAGSIASGGGDFNSDFNNDFNNQQVQTNISSFQVPATLNGCQTIPGVERYPYVGFFNEFLKAQHKGCESIYDTITCAVNWGGTVRPALDWMPWDDFQAFCRSYAVLNTSYPAVWTVLNDGPQAEIYMFPVPSQANEIELDVSAAPAPLNCDDDFDIIQPGFQEAVKYKAASLVFMSTRRYTDAQWMENQFADTLGIARVAVDRGKTPTYYGTLP